ncbi:MAG: hypothetical protein WBK15_00980 [Yoonia sp.]
MNIIEENLSVLIALAIGSGVLLGKSILNFKTRVEIIWLNAISRSAVVLRHKAVFRNSHLMRLERDAG